MDDKLIKDKEKELQEINEKRFMAIQKLCEQQKNKIQIFQNKIKE